MFRGSVDLASLQRPDAKIGPDRTTLVDLKKRKLTRFNHVTSLLHRCGFVDIAGHNGISGKRANSELAGGRLVISVGETSFQTGQSENVFRRKPVIQRLT